MFPIVLLIFIISIAVFNKLRTDTSWYDDAKKQNRDNLLKNDIRYQPPPKKLLEEDAKNLIEDVDKDEGDIDGCMKDLYK